MIGILFVLVSLLLPVVCADSQYQCYDFDPQIYRKSVQTAVSSDGQFIAVAGPDSGIISLFSSNGTLLWGIRTNENITSIAISADGRSVTAGSYLGAIYHFDSSGNLLWNHSGLGCDNRVTISDNGLNGFVFNSGKKGDWESKTVFSYDQNGTILSERSIPQISDGALSSDGTHAVVGTKGNYGNDVILLSGTGDVLWTDTIPDGWKIYGVEISDNGNYIAAVKDDGIYLFNNNGQMLWNKTPKYLTRSIAISPEGEYIVVGMQYKILYFNRSGIQLWDYTLDDYIYHLAISQNGQNIVAASRDVIHYFDKNGTCLWKYPLNDTVDSISMSRDGRVIAVGSYRDTFTIFDKTGNGTTINLKTISVKPIGSPGEVPGRYPETLIQQSYPTSSARESALPDAIAFIAIITIAIIMVNSQKRDLP
ncbi:MAG: DUF5711 family protein [Methanoregula sp.]